MLTVRPDSPDAEQWEDTKMTDAAISEEPTAYEPMPVPDTFVTGVLPIEDLGGLLRVTLYADAHDQRGAVDRRIVSRLILPRDAFASLTRKPKLASEVESAAGVH